jgi:hypothetical protein
VPGVAFPPASRSATASLRTTFHLLRQVLDGPGNAVSHPRTESIMLVLAPGGEAAPDNEWFDATALDRAARAAPAGRDAARVLG